MNNSYLLEKKMNQTTSNPYLTHMGIMDTLKGYASPRSKLTTMIKSGEILRIKRGLYLPKAHTGYSIKTIANMIYGPSCISFEYALAHYGLIPETVQAVTSACFKKNKNKTIKTPVGEFIYRYVNPSTYPYAIQRFVENGSPFLMVSPEKALCDTLSKLKGITSLPALQDLLENDLRIDHEALMELDTAQIKLLSEKYNRRIITLLYQFLK
jgi:hypothetical protein